MNNANSYTNSKVNDLSTFVNSRLNNVSTYAENVSSRLYDSSYHMHNHVLPELKSQLIEIIHDNKDEVLEYVNGEFKTEITTDIKSYEKGRR